MTVRYLTISDVEKLAHTIWHAHRDKAFRNDERKIAHMPSVGINGRSTEFPFRSGEWTRAGGYEVMIDYPKWDYPGSIYVRKIRLLAPQEVLEQFTPTLWVKTAPTRIRPITEVDVEHMGAHFLDREGREQHVVVGRYLCISPEYEMWTCSSVSLARDYYPISEPDERGFRLYKQKYPLPEYCFDIPYEFTLLANGKDWKGQADGGIVTWNGKHEIELDMRVSKRETFRGTYTQAGEAWN